MHARMASHLLFRFVSPYCTQKHALHAWNHLHGCNIPDELYRVHYKYYLVCSTVLHIYATDEQWMKFNCLFVYLTCVTHRGIVGLLSSSSEHTHVRTQAALLYVIDEQPVVLCKAVTRRMDITWFGLYTTSLHPSYHAASSIPWPTRPEMIANIVTILLTSNPPPVFFFCPAPQHKRSGTFNFTCFACYEHTRANPTLWCIFFEGWAGKSSRLTKSPYIDVSLPTGT